MQIRNLSSATLESGKKIQYASIMGDTHYFKMSFWDRVWFLFTNKLRLTLRCYSGHSKPNLYVDAEIVLDSKKYPKTIIESYSDLFQLPESLRLKPDNEKSTEALRDLLESSIIQQARDYAFSCHVDTNHVYHDRSYCYHLEDVANHARFYKHLLPSKNEAVMAIAAAYCHDTIEDARQSYNDVKSFTNERVADIVYAVSNEKGKDREGRANSKYYTEMCQDQTAVFVKLCDRMANIRFGQMMRSNMFYKYKEEHEEFKAKLYNKQFEPMWLEMERLLKSPLPNNQLIASKVQPLIIGSGLL